MSELVENSIVDNLISIHPLLSKSFSRQLRKSTSIGIGSLYIMGLLFREGTMSMSEIGRRLSMPKPHVTGYVDKLAAEGFAERRYDERDRRVINVTLTPAGSEQFVLVRSRVSDEMKRYLHLLGEEQQLALRQATQTVHEYLHHVLVVEMASDCVEDKR